MPSKNSQSMGEQLKQRSQKSLSSTFFFLPRTCWLLTNTNCPTHHLCIPVFKKVLGMQKLADMGNEKNEVALCPDQERSDEKD